MFFARSALLSFGAACLAAVASTTTLAATTGPAATPVNDAATRPMTRDEVRSCLLLRDGLTRDIRANRAAMGALEDAQKPLMAEATEMADALKMLDLSDELAVNTHNARVKAHDAQVAAINEKATVLNEQTMALQVRQSDVLKQCAARPFQLADERAAMKELGLTTGLSQRSTGATTSSGTSATTGNTLNVRAPKDAAR